MFNIDKDVELPKITGRGAPTKYPFGDMDVGDSIRVPRSIHKKVAVAASKYGKANDQRFTCRRQSKTIYRIWRVA